MTYELHLTLLIVSLAVVWVVCGIFSIAGTRAYFIRKYEMWRSIDFALSMAFGIVLGPIDLLATAICGGFFRYGLMFRAPRKQVRRNFYGDPLPEGPPPTINQ